MAVFISMGRTKGEFKDLVLDRAFDRSKASGQSPYPQNLGEWTTLEHL
jgi:hypothetical protein